MEKILLITNSVLELPTAVFGQLSPRNKPLYALLSMLISFTVLLISIIELVSKGKKERVSLAKKGLIPWFYYPYPNFKPFGTFVDNVGLLCGIFQCIFVSIAYIFLSRDADNPIRVSVWPIVFAFGQLYCKFYGHRVENRPALHTKRLHRAEEFSLVQLVAATDHFFPRNKIGGGSFGAVYRGKLRDGHRVVVKRAETGLYKWNESQFEGEVEFISRLNHKHLLRLFGFCEDGDEKLLVYEYMKNGSLDDLLHDDKNINSKSIIYKWKMRIKIALDVARGIEYLHNYAVPIVIHGDIKSSNIMLDANWTGRVSAFGLSLMSPESEMDYKPMKAARTVGYIDPELFSLNHVMTEKSDVYSFGVVLLELLTGKRAIFNYDGSGREPTSVVDFAMPKILSGELVNVLDPRIGPPELNEAKAVELVAYTALRCVDLQGTNRPCMTDVVANLERSLALCDTSSNVEDEPLLKRKMHISWQ